MSSPHVLITRPDPEARQLAQLAEQNGLKPIVSPAMAFRPRAAGIEFDRFWQPGKRKLAIFCSPRAVDFGVRLLPAGFLDGVELAAIGPASANRLEAAGLPPDILPGPPYVSESLLQSKTVSNRPGQAVLFTAPGGRQRLREGLQELGWDVSFAYVYEAVLLDPETAAEREVTQSHGLISVWTSARALAHLSASMAPEAWEKVCRGVLVVTSERLAREARELCAGDVIIAGGPGNDEILATLLKLAAG